MLLMHPSLQNMYISEFLSICAASTLMKFSTMIAFVLSDTSCYAVIFLFVLVVYKALKTTNWCLSASAK